MIELADGTLFSAYGCAARDGALWMYISDIVDINDVIRVFNRDNVQTITYRYGEMENVYTGFNRIVHYSIASGVNTSICLIKE